MIIKNKFDLTIGLILLLASIPPTESIDFISILFAVPCIVWYGLGNENKVKK